MLGPQLGQSRRKRLLDKLAAQGREFFNLALLNRDYWGGSLLQDHGWISWFDFTTAALHLHGLVPEVRLWLQVALPRIDRMIRACPRDGVMPRCTHFSLGDWVDAPAHLRQTLLVLGGPDLYDKAPFDRVVDYLVAVSEPGRDLCHHQHRYESCLWWQLVAQPVGFAKWRWYGGVAAVEAAAIGSTGDACP